MNNNPQPYCALQATLIDALELAMASAPVQRDDRLWFILELFIPSYRNTGMHINEMRDIADFLDDMLTAHSMQALNQRPCLIEADHLIFPQPYAIEEHQHAAA